MSFNGGFGPYVSVAKKREKALKKIEKLRKKNPDITPVIITGSKLATTWWGNSWNKNLESYCDYANRIQRGRTYVRNCAVLDLKITQGNISALVQGSETKPYKVNISISSLNKDVWQDMIKECSGKIESLQELIEGRFPSALSKLFTIKGRGLFPAPKEISFNCSCPDYADMCKHVAAALYGVGARLDEDPGLFFMLRNVNTQDLISESINKKSQGMIEKSKTKSRRVIEETDISDMFGIDLDNDTK